MYRDYKIIMIDIYVSTKKACEIIGVKDITLRRWEKAGKIETVRTKGGQRKYNVEKYLKDNRNIMKDKQKEKIKIEKEKICYIRVSTKGQKEDLERQREYMKKRYPEYKIIEDIGSGINFNRQGLRKIIKLGIEGKIERLVVAYKDRLTRFGYELIEDIIKEYSNGEITIINKQEKKEKEEELVEDVLQILNVYVAKMNGMRKYKNDQK